MAEGGILVLVRHGQSEWNERELYTGRADPSLTEQGILEAQAAGKLLKQEGLQFDIAFTSELRRARDTMALILAELNQRDLLTIITPALNERDFGELTGMTRTEARQRWGKQLLRLWQHSPESPPPGGESLSDIARRVVPFLHTAILPHVQEGRRTLVSAHRHSLRALIAALEGLHMGEGLERDVAMAVPLVYDFASQRPLKGRHLPLAKLADRLPSG